MSGEVGGPGGEAPLFRPRSTRGVRGGGALQVHGVQGGSGGLPLVW